MTELESLENIYSEELELAAAQWGCTIEEAQQDWNSCDVNEYYSCFRFGFLDDNSIRELDAEIQLIYSTTLDNTTLEDEPGTPELPEPESEEDEWWDINEDYKNKIDYRWIQENSGQPFLLFEKVTNQRQQLITALCGLSSDDLSTFYNSCDRFLNLVNISWYKWQQSDDDAIAELNGWGLRYVLNNQQLIAIKRQEFNDGDDSVNTHRFHLEEDLCKRKVLFEKYILRNRESSYLN